MLEYDRINVPEGVYTNKTDFCDNYVFIYITCRFCYLLFLLVQTIKYLGGRYGINCASAFLKILKLPK